MAVREKAIPAALIKELKDLFPGCVVLKNDPNYIQGFPDLTILYKDKWAVLECKKSLSASKRPNQRYYVEMLGEMSYANFVCPENREDVLDELQQAFVS